VSDRPYHSPAPYHQTCKRCHRAQQFEFVVSSKLWRRVNPKGTRWHCAALCVECFLLLASRRGVHIKTRDIRRIYVVQFYRLNVDGRERQRAGKPA
jgi:hypothetical protein